MGVFLLSFIMWAGLHSLAAAPRFKSLARRCLGERAYTGLYHLFYNLFALVTFLPVLYLLATRVPAIPLWIISAPYHFLAHLVQLIGLAGPAVALWQTDIWDFAGLRQALHYLGGGRRLPPPRLVTNGLYALVRHPLYFFSLLLIWFQPVMTLRTLIFNLLATAYFWAGSRIEERRLAAFFGDAYRNYQRQVPAFFPVRFRRFGST